MKARERIEQRRDRPLNGKVYPYLYVDGIYLSRNLPVVCPLAGGQTGCEADAVSSAE